MIISFVACVFMLFLTQASFSIFTRVWSFGDAYSYEDVWRILFRGRLVVVPRVLLIIAYMSCTLYGFWEISDYVPNILTSIWPDAPDILLSPWLLQYVLAVPLCLPSLFVPNIGRFAWTAWLSVFAYTIALGCLIWHLFHRMWSDGHLLFGEVEWVKWDLSADYRILTDFNVAFFAHPFVPIIAREMAGPSRQRTMSMTWVAFLLTAVFVFSVPCVGFLLGSDVEYMENVFYYLNPTDAEVVLGKVAVLIISLCSTAFFQYYIAGIVGKMIHPSVASFGWAAFWGSVILTLPVICLNFMQYQWSSLVYDLGSMCFSVLGFILPPVYFLVQFRFGYVKWSLLASAVLLLGVITLVVSTVVMIDGFVNPVE
jgi:hypothetical protein